MGARRSYKSWSRLLQSVVMLAARGNELLLRRQATGVTSGGPVMPAVVARLGVEDLCRLFFVERERPGVQVIKEKGTVRWTTGETCRSPEADDRLFGPPEDPQHDPSLIHLLPRQGKVSTQM
jgi:hypothetical protein